MHKRCAILAIRSIATEPSVRRWHRRSARQRTSNKTKDALPHELKAAYHTEKAHSMFESQGASQSLLLCIIAYTAMYSNTTYGGVRASPTYLPPMYHFNSTPPRRVELRRKKVYMESSSWSIRSSPVWTTPLTRIWHVGDWRNRPRSRTTRIHCLIIFETCLRLRILC